MKFSRSLEYIRLESPPFYVGGAMALYCNHKWDTHIWFGERHPKFDYAPWGRQRTTLISYV